VPASTEEEEVIGEEDNINPPNESENEGAEN
jgi:hypothetical protein